MYKCESYQWHQNYIVYSTIGVNYMKCLMCGKEFKRHSCNQKFCSNKGRNNCKDRYHNKNRLKLSEARFKYLGYKSEEEFFEKKFVYCDFQDDF